MVGVRSAGGVPGVHVGHLPLSQLLPLSNLLHEHLGDAAAYLVQLFLLPLLKDIEASRIRLLTEKQRTNYNYPPLFPDNK